MDQLAVQESKLPTITSRTKNLIVAGVSENTLRAYRRALKDLEAWMSDGAKSV